MVTLFPIKAKLKMTPQNAVLASVAVVMFAAFLNGHLLYANVLTDININRTVINETKWKVVKSCVLRPGKYTDFYNATWGIILVITSSVVPISLIVTGNAIVGISLIKRKRALLGIAQTDRKSSNLPHQQSRKVFSTKIFFILCAVFVVSTVPYGIYIILLEYNKEVDEHTFARYQLTNILVRSLLWCNFSFNFLLYFMAGSLFKKEFKTMIDSVRGFLQSLIGRRSASPWTGTEERY
ncbi:uncharacterized protein LOC128549346 [Mercenaria mercenaria]|uniref:uncharacterized protein LOC128549346 n=1 Tax=Mercenaria mercenaria TaxID=6596 RepID=UPI00234F3E0A|nr:uncharacterized protein LOC128549346 [Mercenaria mercenaria]